MITTEEMMEIIEKETGFNVYSLERRSDKYTYEEEMYDVEMGFSSDLQEDFLVCFAFDGRWVDFCHRFTDAYQDFDPEEHAAFWIERRGEKGVPNSVFALCDDAKSIDERWEEVVIALDEFAYDDDWTPNPDRVQKTKTA